MITQPSIESVKALNGKIFAMLTPDEEATLNFYRHRGRKFGVAVTISNEANPKQLARARSEEALDQVLKSANSRISVVLP